MVIVLLYRLYYAREIIFSSHYPVILITNTITYPYARTLIQQEPPAEDASKKPPTLDRNENKSAFFSPALHIIISIFPAISNQRPIQKRSVT